MSSKFLNSFSRVACSILDCARRTSTIHLIDPLRFLSLLLEGHPCWSTCGRRTRPFLGRAFREHRINVGVLPILLIVRVPRAGGRPGCPSHPSETPRCTSTEDHQPPSLPLFCEQEGHLATPFPSFLGHAFREPRTNVDVLPIPLSLSDRPRRRHPDPACWRRCKLFDSHSCLAYALCSCYT